MKNVGADIIFTGGDIITVEDSNPSAEFIAIKGEKIIAVGDHNDLAQYKGLNTKVINLEGKTLMPGFIEPHNHPILSAYYYDWIDVTGITNKSEERILEKLRDAANKKKPGEWIAAFGYDPILIPGLKSLTINVLDNISKVHPILVITQNCHTNYFNSKAAEVVGITKDTTMRGIEFIKDKKGKLNGMMIEIDGKSPFANAVANSYSQEDTVKLLKNMLEHYAENGITTVGAAGLYPVLPNSKQILKELVEQEGSPVRMVVMAKGDEVENGLVVEQGSGNDRYRNWGIKFWYDGSFYSGTVFLDEPYLENDLMQNSLGLPTNNYGKCNYSKEQYLELVRKYHDAGWQISTHAHGDRAIREVIDSFKVVLTENPRIDHRHRIEHCALLPHDQLERAARIGLTPSFLVEHHYYYGQALRDEIIGKERAEKLFPMGAAFKAGHTCSIQTDSPMFHPEILKAMRNAVTRKTWNNEVIGLQEAITVDEAIKAVTINAAWHMFMEKKVGSLKVGKYADLVILSDNPRKVDADNLDQIKVISTYLQGKWVKGQQL